VGGAHGVVVGGEEDDVGVEGSFGGKCGEERELVGDVGAGELCGGSGGDDGVVEGVPLFEEVGGAVGGRTIAVAEGVGLVADLEGEKTWPEDAVDGDGFGSSVFFGALAEVEAVEAAPVGGVEKGAEIAESEGCGGGAVLDGLAGVGAEDLEGRWGGGVGVGVGGELAGAAADAEIAIGGEAAEELDELMVLCREEGGIGELGGFVGEAGEVRRDGWAWGGVDGEGDGGRLRESQAGCGGSGGESGEKAATVHRVSSVFNGDGLGDIVQNG